MSRTLVLLFLSLVAAQAAHALAYSSTLDFQVTGTRLQGGELNEIATWSDPTSQATTAETTLQSNTQTTASLVAVQAPTVIPQLTPASTSAPAPYQPKISVPNSDASTTQIYVVDEESLLNGHPQPIQGAQISLINPLLQQKNFVTDAQGIFRIPYPLTESVRIFVLAPGYAPGIGYATMGSTLLVPLYSEKRLSTLLKSLSLNVPSGTVALFIHAFDEGGIGINNAVAKVTGAQSGETIYAGPFFGGIPGYFLRAFKKTDASGTVLLNGLSRSPKHIALESDQNQIGFDIDLTGIPETIHFLSTALRMEKAPAISTSIVDGASYERPDCGIRALTPNYKQGFVPNEDGETWIEVPFQNGLVDMNVETECKEYIKTHVSQVFSPALFPPTTGLFTAKQIRSMLAPVHQSWSTEESLVLGHVYPEKIGIHAPSINSVHVRIFDANGKAAENTNILYFDQNNDLSATQTSTDPHHENFLVLGLEEGEWHFVYSDAESHKGLGVQVVRVRKGRLTQVDF